jgi:hypothetical protein
LLNEEESTKGNTQMNHSDFSNQLSPFAENPSEVFQSKLHTCTPLKPEIGKEPIRFPAFPGFAGKTIIKTKPGSVVFGLKREESAIAVCPITGIVLTIGIPSLPFTLTYENPIAKARNAFKIAALPGSELFHIPSDVIAGTLLSLLSSASLIEDHTTALQRNESLRDSYHHQQLVGMLQTVSKILNALSKPERMKKFLSENPKVSFNESAQLELTIKSWHETVFPIERKPVTSLLDELLGEEKAEQRRKKQEERVTIRKPKNNISLSLRSRIKALAQQLGKAEVISQKASSIFQFLGTGQNWKSLTKDNKKSYLSYLSVRFAENEAEEYDEDIDTLISLVKEIPVDETYNALIEEDDSISNCADKDSGTETPKAMTIKERLAAIASSKLAREQKNV